MSLLHRSIFSLIWMKLKVLPITLNLEMMNANNTKLIKHNQEAILKKKRKINLKVNMYKLKI